MALDVRSTPSFRSTPVAFACGLACLALSLPAAAQPAAGASGDPAELPAVRVTAPAPASRAQVAGFGDVPLSRAPLQAEVVTEEKLKERGARKLSDVTALDASVSDSYNAEGYWDYLSIRGFTLDNRYNYRRDGLPISAETIIPLDNKAGIEILKGTSGIQAGTSAPGGLVNFVVKRPDDRVRSLELGMRSRGTTSLAVDVGDRFGQDRRFGLRVNAAYEDLDPPLRHAEGHRRLLAVAGDWQLTPDTLLEAELETSRRSQPSQAAFSLLGNTLPRPVDPRLNLNNQPWSQPVVSEHHAGSLRLSHRLDADWRVTAHLGTQRLAMDDRLAFPYGCSAEGDYSRYCSDGSYDLYEYISDHERRRTDAAHLYADGRFATGGLRHAVSVGVLHSRHRFRPQDQVYDYAGSGTVDGGTVTPPSAGNLSPNTRRTERSTEFYVRDAITLSPAWSAWAGLRHTRLHRASELTSGDDLEATRYSQSATTPWLALSHEFAPGHIAYVSWGRGLESQVVPNRPIYSNRGQALAALKSRQIELGLKADTAQLDWAVTLFDIRRPQAAALGAECGTSDADGACTLGFDGAARHRGLEGAVHWHQGPWRLGASAAWLHARREGSADASLNGKRPPNVPRHTLKAEAGYRVAAVPGLSLHGAVVHEGERMVLQDNSLRLPSWTRLDVALTHRHQAGGTTLTWRAGIDNLTDRRAWRESPFQFDHVYLYPLAGRTWRLSLQIDL